MSWVFIAGEHVYKLKKPVRHEGLDFTTLEGRRLNCEAEVQLNRRLAPDVYIGTVALAVRDSGALALGGEGRVVDWLVVMRRLPTPAMLDRAIRERRVAADDIRRLARVLSEFYAHAPRIDVDPAEHRRRLRSSVRADLRELVKPEWSLPRQPLEQVAARQLAVLDRECDRFDRRVIERWIVEGHGDLRPEHICLEPHPVVIDCLEFDRDLRVLDPADELAFLALECERLGAPDVGRQVLVAYEQMSGDRPGRRLVRFYRDYRALRRAKLAVWHLRDRDCGDPEKWRRRARWYLRSAAAEP